MNLRSGLLDVWGFTAPFNRGTRYTLPLVYSDTGQMATAQAAVGARGVSGIGHKAPFIVSGVSTGKTALSLDGLPLSRVTLKRGVTFLMVGKQAFVGDNGGHFGLASASGADYSACGVETYSNYADTATFSVYLSTPGGAGGSLTSAGNALVHPGALAYTFTNRVNSLLSVNGRIVDEEDTTAYPDATYFDTGRLLESNASQHTGGFNWAMAALWDRALSRTELNAVTADPMRVLRAVGRVPTPVLSVRLGNTLSQSLRSSDGIRARTLTSGATLRVRLG